jgi:hypothetical protein
MRATFEIPDTLFDRAVQFSAQRRQPVDAYFARALGIAVEVDEKCSQEKPWMRFAGAFKDTPTESAQMRAAIELEFEQIESEDAP